MKTRMTISMLVTSLVLGGCATMTDTQRGTAQGAAIGAGTGAAIGAIIGGGKGAAIGAGSGAVLGAGAGYVWSQRMEEQKRQMESATAGTGVQVSQTADNRLMLNIPSDISFDTGRADIKPNFRPILDSFATSLLNNPGTTIMIVGHTDNTGTDTINNPLSVNRAASTRDYLVSRGVPIQRIQIDGRGSYQPIAPNDSAYNRAKNRRVEIFVMEQTASSPTLPQ
ncbi:outer membrane protein OmpA-like peptidoglycan-associated protein [Nitrosomonas nitrosa]|uniref:Outer membrane protein OmpA n=1 Tax=Nitrosomonas nitrosa TaxID=52442 RepID=A0A1I4MYS0_9PROT|nr:OmpA family protein [Nitrosomonas nitrosa]MCO6434166.1 OmpA family protein [Nitrosomonas nitrosa]PTQ90588.1 outer membrane protein OmpA-like peptidoglycan-associated protein [Nitrosomonas nitrosa]CAE6490139.1 Outer membrane protein OmpA [Nitrosomonas nitrosa]SFM08235.1 Outer membrane protein OmpA [Nitrosomonas nitrosa]HNP51855.1 OmpA family protein [Nitrosomonas nitrosa]